MNSLAAFFDWLVTSSFRATVIALFVLGIQLAFRKQLGARARYVMWLPVLLVLLTPVLPQSRWSVENLFVRVPQTPAILQAGPAGPIAAPGPLVEISAPPPQALDWHQIGLFAWMSVSAALLLFGAFSFIRTLRRFQRTRCVLSNESAAWIEQTAREVGLKHPPRVWRSSAITSPAITGLLRPVLLLPADFEQAFTAHEARLILRHELTHVKRGDLPLNALLCLVMTLHWFNPLLWLAFYKVRLDREAACDAQVLENASPQRRAEYGHALLKAETTFTPLQFSLGFVGLFQPGAALRSRIQSIIHPPTSHPTMKLITLASIGLLTFLGITRAVEPSNVIGKTEFRPGDSIRIINVRRGENVENVLTVTAEYELASEPEAIILLSITRTKGDGFSKSAASQSKTISKGKGTVTLHSPDVREGMPHVSFYPSKGGDGFGGIYFGTAAEAAASLAMKWRMTKASSVSPLQAKLDSIVIPRVKFENATLKQAVQYLVKKSVELDITTKDPAQRGVNIMLKSPSGTNGTTLSLDLSQISLGNVLKSIAELQGMHLQVEKTSVLLTSPQLLEDEQAQTPSAILSSPGKVMVEKKPAAAEILLPSVQFQDATLEEAVEYVRIKSQQLDPAKQGLNILVKPGANAQARITLELKNVPAYEALRYTAELAGCRLVIDGKVMVIEPVK
jgi:beta-lactamase regulating signal transducer with metallopeptidase domain